MCSSVTSMQKQWANLWYCPLGKRNSTTPSLTMTTAYQSRSLLSNVRHALVLQFPHPWWTIGWTYGDYWLCHSNTKTLSWKSFCYKSFRLKTGTRKYLAQTFWKWSIFYRKFQATVCTCMYVHKHVCMYVCTCLHVSFVLIIVWSHIIAIHIIFNVKNQ